MVINYQKIYEKLGYLFYAIASADSMVTATEVLRLKEMVQKIWVPAENATDEFGTDAAQYIIISFDYLMSDGIESDVAFNEFRDYYTGHSSAFSSEMIRNIKRTAVAIAEAFKGQNKMESAVLKRLNALLN